MSCWTRPMDGGEEAVAAPMKATTRERRGSDEERVAARDHVDAGRDHGGRVDERGDRRGAFHGVGEPDVERDLRGLAGGAEDEQEGDGGEEAAVQSGAGAMAAKTSVKLERAEVGDEQEHGEQEAEVADAVDDEGLLAGVGGGVLVEVEADEQVRGEADAFPADEEQQEVLGEDQDRA